ncbi:heparan-alpha-glucosaminide N-acetyltransferase domain-containing protein [Geodermatophilus sp. URMC 61]|uniref:heparan-alpha-glucosaminide N-acetyltransferase domain-containing protein n=1 Tax=Geodermatophilus sp. URMC 61 TaxID=3423411 RepID=UPI00406C4E39
MTAALARGRALPRSALPRHSRDLPHRVVGLDVARALAVFGMLGAHVGAVPDDVGVAPSTWLGVVNGRSSILFAVLAGISVALLSGRPAPVGGDDLVRARVRILVRAAWVFAIGGALEALGTGIDVILGVYAVLFVLALPFLRWPPRRLLLAAGVLAVLTPPAELLLTQLVVATDAYDTPFVSLAVTGAYPALIWWTFILVGLAVGRCELTSTRVRATLLAAGAGLAVAGYGGGWLTTQWFAAGRPVTWPAEDTYRPEQSDPVLLTGAFPHSGTTFEVVGSVGVALVVIAVCLVVADRLPTLLFPLAAVGSMALTAYAGGIVAAWVTGAPDYATNRAWLVYVLTTIAAATVWRLLLGRGPMERLLTWSSQRAAGRGAPVPSTRSAHSTEADRADTLGRRAVGDPGRNAAIRIGAGDPLHPQAGARSTS